MDIDAFLDGLFEDGFFEDGLFDDSDHTTHHVTTHTRTRDTGRSSFVRNPSHVCESCGERYDANPDVEIDTCRSCGGVKVERT